MEHLGNHRLNSIAGMMVVLFLQYDYYEILRSIVLAGLGGACSYLMSLGIKHLVDLIRSYLKK